jgi:putative intracellular protease/amidase
MLAWLQHEAETASLVTSVCTGSALLARAGVLGEAEAEQVAT